MQQRHGTVPSHYWQTTDDLQGRVLREIRHHHVGQERAIKVPHLAMLLGTTQRKVRAAYQALRDRGYPICTSISEPLGVFWPATDLEFKVFNQNFTSRWKSMQRTQEAMRAGWERLKRGEKIEEELQAALW